MTPLLKVESLKKIFVSKQSSLWQPQKKMIAVDKVSFTLNSGETLGIVGESGCGKSTLGKCILRLYEPDQGSVVFNGVDVLRQNAKAMRALRREMQIIFQDPYSSLNPRLRVENLIAEPMKVHKLGSRIEIKEKVALLLDKVGLNQDALRKFPHEFSGGQRQRIGIARALSLSPKLIVADEPVSALDVSVQSQILNLLSGLKKEWNLSFLFISHNLAVVKHISDRVAVMYLGSLVEVADVKDLFARPLHPYTRALISAIPTPEVNSGKPQRIILQGDIPNPFAPPKGCSFNTRCPHATAVCKEQVPKLSALKQGDEHQHLVACHHAKI